MTPLPAALGGVELVAWRLDREKYRTTWNSGEGAYQSGGRWNSRGVRAVYCSLDPATAILEVAVHKTFKTLDVVPHVLTSVIIDAVADVHVVQPDDVANPDWLRSGIPSAGQQEFGDALLMRHRFVAIPSAVSRMSWNLVFTAATAGDSYRVRSQARFSLDTRLNPPGAR